MTLSGVGRGGFGSTSHELLDGNWMAKKMAMFLPMLHSLCSHDCSPSPSGAALPAACWGGILEVDGGGLGAGDGGHETG